MQNQLENSDQVIADHKKWKVCGCTFCAVVVLGVVEGATLMFIGGTRCGHA